jgi:hypothetical protein
MAKAKKPRMTVLKPRLAELPPALAVPKPKKPKWD